VAAEEIPRNKDVVAIVRQSIKVEPSNGDWTEEDDITSPQIQFIDTKCKQLNVNVIKFINQGDKKYEAIGDVRKMTASKMIKLLNEYQNKSKEIPDDIVGYNNNWR
jgi:putative NADH-flavin reductase